MNAQKPYISGMLFMLEILIIPFLYSCHKTPEFTLIDSLRSGNRIHLIEQLGLTTYSGLPSANTVRNAPIIRIIKDQSATDEFEEILLSSSKGHGDYNHPAALGQVILRLTSTNGTFYLLCDKKRIAYRFSCFIECGSEGEMNFNNMNDYESHDLHKWFDKYGIEVLTK